MGREWSLLALDTQYLQVMIHKFELFLEERRFVGSRWRRSSYGSFTVFFDPPPPDVPVRYKFAESWNAKRTPTAHQKQTACCWVCRDMVSRRGYRHRHVRLLLILALLLLSSPTIMVHSFMPSLCFRPLLRRSRWYRFASNTDTTTTTTQPEPPAPSSSASAAAAAEETQQQQQQQPLLLAEGILAVDKPLDWTSSDVVSYIRGMLERDARQRGLRPGKVGRKNGRRSRDKKNNSNGVIRVGHGGTLDPLATGVLVVAVGKGTKELQRCVHIME